MRTYLIIVVLAVTLAAAVWSVRHVFADVYGSSLVGYYPMEIVPASANIADASGTGNNLKLIGGQATTTHAGVIGQAITLNGNNSATSTTPVVTAVPLTICVWFRPTTLSGVLTKAIAVVTDGAGIAGVDGFLVRLLGSGGSFATTITSASGGTLANISNTPAVLNKWHHVCGGFSTNTSRDMYQDGAFVANNTTSNVPGTLSVTAVGGLGSGTGSFLGDIDDVRIYNRALSAAEIATIYYYGRSQHYQGAF